MSASTACLRSVLNSVRLILGEKTAARAVAVNCVHHKNQMNCSSDKCQRAIETYSIFGYATSRSQLTTHHSCISCKKTPQRQSPFLKIRPKGDKWMVTKGRTPPAETVPARGHESLLSIWEQCAEMISAVFNRRKTVSLPRPVKVEAREGYRIRLEYSDGVSGEVDLSHLVDNDAFKTWKDRECFESVYLDCGDIAWSVDAGLCHNALYMQITGKTAEELLPGVRSL